MLPPSSPSHAIGAINLFLTEIIIPERMRKDTPDIQEKIELNIVPSIAEHGLIHPPLVVEHEMIAGFDIFGNANMSRYSLIAGWSRLTAFKLLGYDTIPVNFHRDLPAHERCALELEENIRRNPMNWQDIVKGIAKTHLLKKVHAAQTNAPTWGVRQMGALIGMSAGYVQEALILAKLLESGDKDICDAPTATDARKVLIQRKEDAIAAELRRRHEQKQQQTSDKVVKIVGKFPVKVSTLLDDLPAAPVYDLMSPSGSSSEPERTVTVDLSSRFFNGDSVFAYDPDDGEDRLKASLFSDFDNETFDLIYTDIPFGIDMANLQDLVNVDRIEDAHDIEENLSQMPIFLRESYRVLKPNTYLLFWYDIKHQEKLATWAQDAGFKVQPYPNVWIKTHSCKNKAAHCHWTKAIEYVMVCRKGRPTLKTPQAVNYFSCSGAAERKLQSNPFSKPFEFSKWLLEPVLFPGAKVLDCYAGEGSLVRALLNLGADVTAFEKETTHFNKLIEHVKEYYTKTIKGKVEFV